MKALSYPTMAPRSLRPLHTLDSIALVSPAMADAVVVSGSHAGTSAAGFVVALAQRPYAVILNDAGVGKDQAGIAGLAMLQRAGVLALACSHQTARIGEAQDALENGVISHLNGLAQQAGLQVGMTVADVVAALR
jgi:hypothetical protein